MLPYPELTPDSLMELLKEALMDGYPAEILIGTSDYVAVRKWGSGVLDVDTSPAPLNNGMIGTAFGVSVRYRRGMQVRTVTDGHGLSLAHCWPGLSPHRGPADGCLHPECVIRGVMEE
jgi:hypothetical protein